MSEFAAQNPYAPPRAQVEDGFDPQSERVQATRVSRLVAVIIDGLALGGVVAIVGIVAAIALPAYVTYQKRATGASGAPSGPVLVVIGVLAFVVIAALFIYNGVLVYRYGQTIGKRVMGIRVVRTDGSRVAFGRFVFLRWLPLFVIGLIPWIGYISGMLDALLIFRDSNQCLHDNIADTIVVTAASAPNATLEGSLGR